MSSAARATNRLLKGISSKPVERLRRLRPVFGRATPLSRNPALPAENHLEHEFAAHVGNYEQAGAGEDPMQRSATAPAVAMATEKQRAEHEPAEQRKHDLVREAQRFAEQFLGKQNAAHERQGQQRVAHADQAKQ